MNSKKSTWRGRIVAYAPIILWIGLIFFLSSGSGSMAATSRIIRPVLEFLFPAASEESLQLIHFYIRKAAHFTEYAVLALLAIRAFRRSPGNVPSRYFYLFSMASIIAVAGLDEINQGFNPSRTSSGWDVLLDISGGFFAVVGYYLVSRQRSAKQTKYPK